ncbi:MAG: nucleoside kinase [bacterium]|nr:nucleoside kinase [bacterium]
MEMIYPENTLSTYNRFYRQEHTLTVVMLAAAQRIAPHHDIVVHHRFAGGLYCTGLITELNSVERGDLDLDRLASEMKRIVESGESIESVTLPFAAAMKLLQEQEWPGTARLLEQNSTDSVRFWSLAGTLVWLPDEPVCEIAGVSGFAIEKYKNGFVIRLPDRNNLARYTPFAPSEKLFQALVQANDWGVKTRVYDLGTLNIQIANDPIGLILTAETLHEQYLTDIARAVTNGLPNRRVVLIAGPSSSGKTTFSRRLMIQLRAMAIHSLPIPMDDYFKDRDICPKDEFGNYDFEHFECLDRETLSKDIAKLLRGESIVLPKFDFISGTSKRTGKTVQLHANEVLILEGIHGLNPNLLPEIDSQQLTRIFVSALTNLNVDRHSRIPTSDIRLLRRMVRDYRTRGHSPTATLSRWDSVRKGEDHWIFPFQDNADLLFNSALVYEIACLRNRVHTLLSLAEVKGVAAEHAGRIRMLLDLVRPIDHRAIPLHSVIREFIGGGVWEV